MILVKKIISFGGITLVVVGFLFKILHWPFGTILLFSGLTIYGISVVLSFFNKQDEEKENPNILDDI